VPFYLLLKIFISLPQQAKNFSEIPPFGENRWAESFNSLKISAKITDFNGCFGVSNKPDRKT
jgi:hypothetical protein